jgi:deoxyribodipyrimidine photolyase-related protein
MNDLVPVFSDQLTRTLSAFQNTTKEDAFILMMEVAEEADQVWHHRKKLVFLFSAMRHFARELEGDGWTVRYVRLDDEGNAGTFSEEVRRAVEDIRPDRILVTEPGEWRVEEMIRDWRERFDCEIKLLRDHRFLSTRQEFADWAEGRKELRMENFYREMRKATGLLMEDGKPVSGQWNFDHDNRKPPKNGLDIPDRPRFEPDEITVNVMKMVEDRFPDRFGEIEPFNFAVTSADAEKALDHFISECLPMFGDYQDAMVTGEAFLYHSLLSAYINAGLLDPLKTCQAAEAVYAKGNAPINAVEGFIRQIIGWREFIRGIYWMKMPGYEDENFFDAKEDLPDFYWTGETKMRCISEVVRQTREYAYSHHIQRLMITGNFALLAGIAPKQVHEWYLAVYADAYEWVEMPNTIGMALFADGGLLASKPYAASANYINKMSDFCGNCSYAHNQNTGDSACPFNSLFWDFLDRNRDKLANNHRMGMMYRNLDRKDDKELAKLRERAENVLEKMRSGAL